MTILIACTKMSGNLLKAPRTFITHVVFKAKTSFKKEETLNWLVGWFLCLMAYQPCRLYNAKSILLEE